MDSYRNEDRLRELYVEEGLTIAEIAEYLDCSPSTVHKYIHQFEIPIQNPEYSSPKSEWTERPDPDRLRELYHGDRMNIREIGKKYGVSYRTAWTWLDDAGIERRSKSMAKVLRDPGVYFGSQNGYERVAAGYQGEQYTVLVHRLIAIGEFGFDTVAGNDVHHKNGVPWDNRPSNLEILSHSDHARLHREEQIERGFHPRSNHNSES